MSDISIPSISVCMKWRVYMPLRSIQCFEHASLMDVLYLVLYSLALNGGYILCNGVGGRGEGFSRVFFDDVPLVLCVYSHAR